jgi:predicted DCC family thiol-disulfide oxidoreductase YuxK
VTAPALLLYDGGCGLCDRAVRFLAARDRRGRLRFAPLQGEAAAPWRESARTSPAGPFEWLVLVEDDRVRRGADAVARALVLAGGSARALGALLTGLPRPLADRAYRALARRRGRLFPPSCALPPPGDARFVR